MKGSFLVLFASLVLSIIAGGQTLNRNSGPWELERSGTTADLRGIHAVGQGIAWASGTNGTILRTEDDGYEWQRCAVPPSAEKLDFRGIWAWDNNTAIVMSSGPGDRSRLYKTTDGCAHWVLLFSNPDKDGFWDAMVFRDRKHGLILGDPTEETQFKSMSSASNGRQGKHFVLLQTDDAGSSWKRRYTRRGVIPGTESGGRGAFAASNSVLTVEGPWGWFGVSGKSGAFVYTGHETLADAGPPFESQGFAWFNPSQLPLRSGTDSSGVFSIAFRPDRQKLFDTRIASDKGWWIPQYGVAVGGDYARPSSSTRTAAWSADGGKTWAAATRPPHGYRSAVAWDGAARVWIAVGTNGSDISYDNGNTWVPSDGSNWNALSLPWAVGPRGRIGKLNQGDLPHPGCRQCRK